MFTAYFNLLNQVNSIKYINTRSFYISNEVNKKNYDWCMRCILSHQNYEKLDILGDPSKGLSSTRRHGHYSAHSILSNDLVLATVSKI